MYKYNKLDQIAIRNLIYNYVFPCDSVDRTILIIYYTKFNATNLIIFNYFSLTICYFSTTRGYPRGVMVKSMDCGIVVSEFELQSRYYVHFRAKTLGKGMNPLILPAMG